jgi:hypothetical protein
LEEIMAKAEYGAIVSEISGKVGEGIFVHIRGGAVIRRPPTYRRPTTPAQQEAQDRMSRAMDAYNTLTREQAQAWNHAADTLLSPSEAAGKTTRPTGQNLFLALATKYLQVHPNGTVPLVPPTTPFMDDDVLPTAQGGAGEIVWTANQPNEAPLVIELLTQKLKNQRRTPTHAYRSAGFHQFEAGKLDYALSVEAGWYAVAFRSVNSATGQMGLVMPLGVVEVS